MSIIRIIVVSLFLLKTFAGPASCPNNCEYCNEGSNYCSKCKLNYHLSSSSPFSVCSVNDGNALSSDCMYFYQDYNSCQACNPGLTLLQDENQNYVCLAIQSPPMEGCALDEGGCSLLKPGYTAVQGIPTCSIAGTTFASGDAITCGTVQNCKTYRVKDDGSEYDQTTCLVCNDNFEISADGKTCGDLEEENGMETEEETEQETEVEAESEDETEVEGEIEQEIEVESEEEVEAETEQETEVENEDEVEIEAETEQETESEDETEVEGETEQEIEEEVEAETETETEQETEVEDENESEIEEGPGCDCSCKCFFRNGSPSCGCRCVCVEDI